MATRYYLFKLGTTLVLLVTWLCFTSTSAQGDEANFAEPTALVTVNSFYRDRFPAISPNGLELYFQSDRVGGINNPDGGGQTDIWVASRSSVLQPFGTPVLAPGAISDQPFPINSTQWEQGPDLSSDGLTLYFASNPVEDPDPNRRDEIYYVTRASLQSPWENPVQMPEGVNTEAWSEQSPNISSDGLELYFARQQPPYNQIGDYDIWRSTRASTSDPWGAATLLNINVSNVYDGSPSLSGDDLTLYFTSYRDGGMGSGDIWISQRASKSDPWGVPVNPGAPLNTSEFDGWADVSVDGSTLYFSRGGWFFDSDPDLWQATSYTTQDRIWLPDESEREWSDSLAWKYGSAPNSNNRNAIFGNAITQDRIVRVNSPATARSIRFDNAQGYYLTGLSTVTLEADTGNASVSVVQGSHHFQVAANLNSNTDVDVADEATLTFDETLTLNGRVLTKTGNGKLVINDNAGVGTVEGMAGTISGVGTVAGLLNNNSATLAPGNGPGIFTVDGDYTQGVGGTLAIEIGGSGPGQFDALHISGAADFAGDLFVTLINAFNPTTEFDFDILDFSSATGSLHPILPDLDPSLMWDLTNLLTTGSLSIVNAGPDCDFDGDGLCGIADIDSLVADIVAVKAGGIPNLGLDLTGDGEVDNDDLQSWLIQAGAVNPDATNGNPYLDGDINLDGVVDVSDFNIWNGNKFQPGGMWSLADLNADGLTDVSDFNLWNSNKFRSSAGSTVLVPESTNLGLLMISILGFGTCIVKRRRTHGTSPRTE